MFQQSRYKYYSFNGLCLITTVTMNAIIHGSFTIILPLLLLVASVSLQRVSIIPNNFTGVCPDYRNQTCLTLAELASNTSRLDQTNITLNFIPGDHSLTQRVRVSNATHLVFAAHVCNASQCEIKIKCQGTSGFEFQNIESINITGFEFSGCGGEDINGGALNVNNVTFLSILYCRFIGNGVFGVRASGGAVYIDSAFNVSIHSNYFINNSAECNQYCDSAVNMGGAIFMIDLRNIVFIIVNFCHFEQNSAHSGGGAIASIRTILIILHSMFVYNKVPSQGYGGGAVYVTRGGMYSSSSHYTMNKAKIGGSIFIDTSSVVYSSNDTYTYNSADSYGGAISGNTTSFDNNNNTFSNNSAKLGGVIYMQYSNISSIGSYYGMNRATEDGGTMYLSNTHASIADSYFTNNRATSSGGSLYVETGNVSISGSYFSYNQAESGAVISVHNSSVYASSCSYLNNCNRALNGGGGVMYADSSSITSLDSYYTNNSASTGGVFHLAQSFLQTSKSYYSNNTATRVGGALYCACFELSHVCSIVSIGNFYMSNVAQVGGGITALSYNVITTNDYYSVNYAEQGGAAINHIQGTLSISGTSFYNNNASSGAIVTDHSSVSISHSHFTNNTGINGGALNCITASLSILHSNYTGNQAQYGGAIAMFDGISISCSYSYFVSNIAFYAGGAIYGKSGNVACTSCYFKQNLARQGGAISIEKGNVSSVNSTYSENAANGSVGGGINVVTGSVSSSGCNYTSNHGGAIYINTEGSIFSLDSCYANNDNIGNEGGAMFINNGNVYCNRSEFFHNTANNGGAIKVRRGNVSLVNSYFTYNRALYGGAICVLTDTVVSSTGCQYKNNSALIGGGAIYSDGGAVTSTDTNYTNNYSVDIGGALYVVQGSIYHTDSNLIANKAHRAGGAITAVFSDIHSDSSYYGNNHAQYGGAIFTISCTKSNQLFLPSVFDQLLLARTQGNQFICDKDTLSTFDFDNLICTFAGETIFTNNTCTLVGGAILSIQVGVFFNGTVPAVVSNNVAATGGGIALAGSTLNIHSPVEIQDNEATQVGGGIYSYQSDIKFKLSSSSSQATITIGGNTASQNGGGMYAVDSYIEITRGVIYFENNVASKGGAISLKQNSKIYLSKEKQETVGEYDMKLEFIDNHAQYGGAVYVLDSSASCKRGVPGANLTSQECFIQTLLLNTTVSEDNTKTNFINIFFVNNTANVSGGAIYGGLLDRCLLNHSTEVVTQFPEYRQLTGFDYIRATTQFFGLTDYGNLTSNYNPDYLINAITSRDVEGLISSEPVQVCFCLDNVHNCSYDHPNVYTKKGQLFQLSVVAVDHVGNPINATVISSFVSNNGDLNVDQARQKTTTSCTQLEYNVYPKGDSKSSQIELYAEGPCSDLGISKRVLNVAFLPCTCPIGFQPVETETQCTCDCDPILRPAYIANCSYANETVLRDSNAWIVYANATTEPGYLIYPNCPFDYCVDKPVNVNLNILNGADIQCAFNRSGKLCGACKKNFSLSMGSSLCQECSNSFISLIIPFALAGIALVVFILMLNVTVATGMIHGLVFYANILVASRSIFIPFDTPNILIIFISWINLDLGVETCFYNGMDSYAKVLLQLAFPTYIILITIMIIIISEYSIRFSTLIGKKDPVATLCTLILLSYSKLIRTIIASLQFTYLNYPDDSSEIVWLYDANVPYFSPSHIPRFVTAIIIIILSSIYTILIFFGQWLPRCGNRKFLRWVNNPKYNAFIVKYHAPFNPKHRYWVGLLLLARIFHYLLSAFVPDSAILLSVCCIVLGLVQFKTRFYKHHQLDILETSFLVNLGVFTYATYYNIVRERDGNQIALASTSLGLTFIIFLGILIYHIYAYILKDTQCWGKIIQFFQRIIQFCKRRNNYERAPLEEDQQNMDDNNEQHEQIIEMQPHYTNDNDTNPNDLPQHYDPPVIVPAVRYDQPREPALDILDPITTDDYRQLNQPPAPRPRQVPTTTVIDFVRPRRSVDILDHP